MKTAKGRVQNALKNYHRLHGPSAMFSAITKAADEAEAAGKDFCEVPAEGSYYVPIEMKYLKSLGYVVFYKGSNWSAGNVPDEMKVWYVTW